MVGMEVSVMSAKFGIFTKLLATMIRAVIVCLISGGQSSYGHGGQTLGSGYGSSYGNQGGLGGYNDYSECLFQFLFFLIFKKHDKCFHSFSCKDEILHIPHLWSIHDLFTLDKLFPHFLSS